MESDSILTMNGFNSDEYDLAPFGHILRTAKVIANCSLIQSCRHVRQEANMVGHYLARAVISYGGFCVWLEEIPT